MLDAASVTTAPRAGVLRRLAAIAYDSLLLLAVLFIASWAALPFTHGEAVHANNPLFTSYLFLITFFFFAWFWIHGGQTLGMRAWRLRVQLRDGNPIGWWHALLRFLTGLPAWGLLGLGIAEHVIKDHTQLPALVAMLYRLPTGLVIGVGALWVVLDNTRWSLRDRYSETVVVLLPKGVKG